MKIIIAKIARQEFDEAKQFFEIRQAGLGARFEKEIKNSLLRIKQYPSAWPIERGEIRHYLIHKFPYKNSLFGPKEDNHSTCVCTST